MRTVRGVPPEFNRHAEAGHYPGSRSGASGEAAAVRIPRRSRFCGWRNESAVLWAPGMVEVLGWVILHTRTFLERFGI
jgi:hypothetical protein